MMTLSDIVSNFLKMKENPALFKAIQEGKTTYIPNEKTGEIGLLDSYIDESGNETYGYGIETKYINKKAKTIPEMEVQFKQRLSQDINFVNSLKDSTGKVLNLNDNQKTALTSLIYNVGQEEFKKSKAYDNLISGNMEGFKKEAFDSKEGFVYSKGDLSKGLINRRQEELNLFNKPIEEKQSIYETTQAQRPLNSIPGINEDLKPLPMPIIDIDFIN
jgi:GH24 family phage-related lysozyme (muramidase)